MLSVDWGGVCKKGVDPPLKHVLLRGSGCVQTAAGVLSTDQCDYDLGVVCVLLVLLSVYDLVCWLVWCLT